MNGPDMTMPSEQIRKPPPAPTAGAVREDISRARAELSDTVSALVNKFDVKTQAQKSARRWARVASTQGRSIAGRARREWRQRPALVIAAAAVALAFAAFIVRKRRQ